MKNLILTFILFLSACIKPDIELFRGKPVSKDRQPPVIVITSPSNGSTVTDITTITTNATDNVGVVSVTFSVNGTSFIDNVAPYLFSWSTTSLQNGTYTVTATARDGSNNTSSASISLIKNVVVEPPVETGVSLKMPPVLHQGNEGSCVAFAVAYYARSSDWYYKTGEIEMKTFSPEFVFNQVTAPDCAGTSMELALNLLVNKGVCTFTSMPYTDQGCTQQPNAQQFTEALNYKISGYTQIYYKERQIIKSMIDQKRPVVITILGDNSFIAAKTGFIWKQYSGSGMLAHTVVICGYDDSKNAYKIINSWGTSWGDAGYSFIDYDFFETGGRTAGAGYVYTIN